MSSKYKEEKIMKGIIYKNVTLVDNSRETSLITYCKNNKAKNLLLMKNHPRPNESPLKEHMVMCRFTCPLQGCPGSYIGMTTMCLSKRISSHLQAGVIFRYYRNRHQIKPTRDALLKCVAISGRADNELRLHLKETMLIEKERPTLNTTDEVKRLALDTTDEVKILMV